MTKKEKSENTLFYLLGSIQILVAITALPGGLALIIDPTGEASGMDIILLKGTPFTDFFVPGIFLFGVHCIGNSIGAVSTFKKRKSSGLLGIFLGALMVVWIVFQITWIGLSNFLQPLYFVVGLLEGWFGYRVYIKLKS